MTIIYVDVGKIWYWNLSDEWLCFLSLASSYYQVFENTSTELVTVDIEISTTWEILGKWRSWTKEENLSMPVEKGELVLSRKFLQYPQLGCLCWFGILQAKYPIFTNVFACEFGTPVPRIVILSMRKFLYFIFLIRFKFWEKSSMLLSLQLGRMVSFSGWWLEIPVVNVQYRPFSIRRWWKSVSSIVV
jgi:hypothetical protein